MSSPWDPRALLNVASDAVRTITGAFVDGLSGKEIRLPSVDTEPRAAKPAAPATPATPATPRATPRATPPAPPSGPDPRLGSKMASLLGRALEQSTSSGTDELYHRILDQLVPDEARMLSALSDGSSSPLVSVHALTRAGMLGETLIENASLVGRTANVALPAQTPTYVGHLLGLGLLEIGPEDDTLKDDYQILLADTDVLRAIRHGSRGPVPARVSRRTVRLSALGRDLWAASTGPEEGGQP